MFTLLSQNAGKWEVVGHTMDFDAVCLLARQLRKRGTNPECLIILDIRGDKVAWDEMPDE